MTRIICPYCEQDYVWSVVYSPHDRPRKKFKFCFECETVWDKNEEPSDQGGIGLEFLEERIDINLIEKLAIVTFNSSPSPEDCLVSLILANNISPLDFNFTLEGPIVLKYIFDTLVDYIDSRQLKNIPEELIDDLLQAIDDSDFEITPDQRAILERHASPSPPQNFSP